MNLQKNYYTFENKLKRLTNNYNRSIMYDKFESFRRMEMQRFNFIPVWYHIWVGGQKIQSSNGSAMIMANPIEVNGEQKMDVA